MTDVLYIGSGFIKLDFNVRLDDDEYSESDCGIVTIFLE